MSKPNLPSNSRILLALFSVQVVWAFNYLFSKNILGTIPPMIWASFRSLATAVLLMFLAITTKRPLPRLNSEFITPLLFFGTLNTLTHYLFLIGLFYTTSSNSAILNSITPLVTLGIAIAAGREQLDLTRILGFVFSILGVSIVCRIHEFNFSNETFLGDFLTLLSYLCYGSFLGLSKDFFNKFDKIWITASLFLVSGIALTVLALPRWLQFHWPAMTPSLWGALLYGVFFGSLVGYYLMIWVVAYCPASQVAIFDYLQPVLVSFLGWYFLAEEITSRTWWGGSLILLGAGISLEWKPKTNLFHPGIFRQLKNRWLQVLLNLQKRPSKAE